MCVFVKKKNNCDQGGAEQHEKQTPAQMNCERSHYEMSVNGQHQLRKTQNETGQAGRPQPAPSNQQLNCQ